MKRVAVTGVSGYLGGLILKALDTDEDVESVVGIDIKPPKHVTAKLKFHAMDVREPLADIFSRNKIDSAFHLAFVVPPHTDVDAHGVNIDGSKNFLRACEATGVESLLYQSSHTVYGARPDNPALITEEQPLRPVPEFPYGSDKAEVDRMFQEYMETHPRQSVAIVRTVAVVGPEAGASGLSVLFLPVTMYVKGFDPPWQFIFEGDLAELDVLLVKERKSGIFNAGAEGSVRYREMLGYTGKPSLGLPAWLWEFLVSAGWKLGLQRKSQAGGLEYMKHPVLVSAKKLAETTGFKFTMSSREALKSFMDTDMAGAKRG